MLFSPLSSYLSSFVIHIHLLNLHVNDWLTQWTHCNKLCLMCYLEKNLLKFCLFSLSAHLVAFNILFPIWFHHKKSIIFQILMQLSFCSGLSKCVTQICDLAINSNTIKECWSVCSLYICEIKTHFRYLIVHIQDAQICLCKKMNREVSVSLYYTYFNVTSPKVIFKDCFLKENRNGSKIWPVFCKPMLPGPDCWVVLCVLHDGTHDDQFRDLSWWQGQTVIPWILLPDFLV